MSPPASTPDAPPAPAACPAGRGGRLQTAALVCLLAGTTARCFLAELPFEQSALQFLPADRSRVATQPVDNPAAYRADTSELSRMTFAVLLLAAGALWALDGALAGGLVVCHAYLAGLIGAFAGLSLISALAASNRRSALDGWLEQVALLTAGFLAIQLCRGRRRFALLVIVLAAAGAALAAKGFWQRAAEIPERIVDFDAHRVDRLTGFGWDPNTPQAALIEARVRDTSITGYFALANPFGSLLLVCGFAAAGLAIDKLRAGVRSWREGRSRRRKGEMDAPSVAAGVTALAAAGVAVALPMTHSRGAIVSAVVAAAALAVVLWRRETLARRWRTWVIGVAAASALAAGGAAAYGLATDRLPTRTMTFRWHYWTATAEIVGKHPVFGVGPGNFATAYLQARRDEAEEAVQMPHNLVAHALAAYGVPGGLCYLGVIACLLVGCARPRREPPGDSLGPAGPDAARREARLLLVAVPVAVLLARLLFWDKPEAAFLTVLGLAGPTGLMAVLLAVAAWSGRGVWRGAEGFACAARPALACGVAGFVLHNMVTYSLWLPGTAGAFYLAAGACLAGAGGRERTITGARWAVAGPTVLAVVVAALLFWVPVMRRTYHTGEMLAALRVGNVPGALRQAQQAYSADTLSPWAAADAAEVSMMHVEVPGTDAARDVAMAVWLSEEALERDRQSATFWRQAANFAWVAAIANHRDFALALARANAAWRAGKAEQADRLWRQAAELAPVSEAALRARRYLRRAVELNPKDSRLRIRCAEILIEGDSYEAPNQLEEALRLDAALPAESVERLRPAERERIDMLRARAKVLNAPSVMLPMTAPTRPATAPARPATATQPTRGM